MAYFWDPESDRLIRKPKDRGLRWSRVTKGGTPYDGQGGTLFLWADRPFLKGERGVVGGAEQEPESSWWYLGGVDLSGGDTKVQTCGSLKHAQTIMRKKTTRYVVPHPTIHTVNGTLIITILHTRRRDVGHNPVAYQLDMPRKTLHTKPTGEGAQWCTGGKSMGIFVWGKSTGLTRDGKILIECRDVDLVKDSHGVVDSELNSSLSFVSRCCGSALARTPSSGTAGARKRRNSRVDPSRETVGTRLSKMDDFFMAWHQILSPIMQTTAIAGSSPLIGDATATKTTRRPL